MTWSSQEIKRSESTFLWKGLGALISPWVPELTPEEPIKPQIHVQIQPLMDIEPWL